MNKIAKTDHEIIESIKIRWSPRAFSSQPVEHEKIMRFFEAARWAPSSNNRQPWAFIVTTRQTPKSYEQLLGTLNERNQAWAKTAPVLVLSVAQIEYDLGRTNHYALYDLGQAVANLSIQASAMGLGVRQMGGFDRAKAAQLFDLPLDYQPVTVFAIGYPGDPQILPEEFRDGESATRNRKSVAEFAYEGKWQEPLKVTAHSLK